MKDIAEEVIERTKGMCEICYGPGEHLHHAVSGKGKRIEHQNQYSVYNLCRSCHELVHSNRFEDLRLKFETQKRYKELGLSEKEIKRLMGDRLYIKEDVEEVFNRRNKKVNDYIVESVIKGLI